MEVPMLRRPLFILLLLIPVLTLAPRAHAQAPPVPFKFTHGASAENIPFELNSNKVYLRVRIDGGPPRWFILDSGCPVTAIDLDLARTLGLTVTDEGMIGGAGEGRTQSGMTRVKSLSLPGLDLFPRQALAIAVDKAVSQFEGRHVDGLLGVDFLRTFVVRLDYPNRRLSIYRRDAFQEPAGAIAVPAKPLGGHFTVQATLHPPEGAPIQGTFILDIGVRNPLMVNTHFVNRHNLINRLGARHRVTVGGGLGGEVIHHLVRIPQLRIGQVAVDQPFITLSQDRAGAFAATDSDGILGAEIFRRYRFSLDLGGGRVLFEETPEARNPYDFDMSGMFLVAEGKEFKTFRVLGVRKGSPADVAGIKAGDIIKGVDGRPAERWSLEALRVALRQAGKTVSVKWLKDGRPVTAILTLRRLV
jgi:hypothetical protein